MPDNYEDKILLLQEKVNAHRPFEDENLLNQIRDFYRVDCTWSSNAIEGVSYTLSETKILLEDGLTAGGRPFSEAMAVIGHGKAYDHMFSLLRSDDIREEDLLRMHSLLEGGLANDAAAGKYRTGPVFISGSRYPCAKAEKIPDLMKKLVSDCRKWRGKIHPVMAAAKLHRGLVLIHPFGDGNGRVARLAMNCLLIQNGYLPICIPPVLRTEYVQNLELSHKDEKPFVDMIFSLEYETQKDFLRMLNAADTPESKNSPAM